MAKEYTRALLHESETKRILPYESGTLLELQNSEHCCMSRNQADIPHESGTLL